MSEKPDLVTFVRERLAEREVLANAATSEDWEAHRWHGDRCFENCDDPGCFQMIVSSTTLGMIGDTDTEKPEVFYVERDPNAQGEADAHFIAANDPAYVLRDIAAKRAVCDGYDYAAHQVANATFTGVEDAAKILVEKQQLATLTQVLKIFAAVNETHADYNPEWRVT